MADRTIWVKSRLQLYFCAKEVIFVPSKMKYPLQILKVVNPPPYFTWTSCELHWWIT